MCIRDRGRIAINAINELVREAGKPEWKWEAPAKNEPFIAKVAELAEGPLRAAYQIRSKQARTQACRDVTHNVLAALKAENIEFDKVEIEGLPVSYTHLDVYKRQGPGSCARCGLWPRRRGLAALVLCLARPGATRPGPGPTLSLIHI